ncbi:MAG: FGGY family carbohydrate kinase, partial [Mesorhizobium sp.]
MFLGIDLGTSSVKAALIDEAGKTLAEASRLYPVRSPRPGYAETTVERWWESTVAAVRECTAGRGDAVRGIGFSGQAHGVVVLDQHDRPLRPAILWADQRTTAQVSEVLALPAALRLPLANPAATGMAGLSLMWLRDNEPATYAATRRALSPKDWLRFAMTGEIATEPSDASMTLLYDVVADRWSTELIEALRLDAAMLAPIIDSSAVAGRLTRAAAQAFGLPSG